MSVMGETLGAMDWRGLGTQIVFWIGWGFVGLITLFAMATLFYIIQYNMKVDTWTLYGSGKDGVFSIGKKKKNRVKWINKKSAWKPLFPLLNKVELEPFDSEFIYPGKQMYAFILNDKWVPGRVNISVNSKKVSAVEKCKLEEEVQEYLKGKYPDKEEFWKYGSITIDKNEDELRLEINPVPHYVRNWQSLQHKKNAKEFAEHNFWEDNKYFFMVIITSAICLIMVGVTVYFTYKFATGGSAAMSNLAGALRSWNSVPSI